MIAMILGSTRQGLVQHSEATLNVSTQGVNINQIENQTLLVIGDYTPRRMNPRGELQNH